MKMAYSHLGSSQTLASHDTLMLLFEDGLATLADEEDANKGRTSVPSGSTHSEDEPKMLKPNSLFPGTLE